MCQHVLVWQAFGRCRKKQQFVYNKLLLYYRVMKVHKSGNHKIVPYEIINASINICILAKMHKCMHTWWHDTFINVLHTDRGKFEIIHYSCCRQWFFWSAQDTHTFHIHCTKSCIFCRFFWDIIHTVFFFDFLRCRVRIVLLEGNPWLSVRFWFFFQLCWPLPAEQ